MTSETQSPLRSLVMTVLVIAVAIPPIFYTKHLLDTCKLDSKPLYTYSENSNFIPNEYHTSWSHVFSQPEDFMCKAMLHHPILYANIQYAINVNIGFWIIGLILDNTFLIDLYWVFINTMLGFYYRYH